MKPKRLPSIHLCIFISFIGDIWILVLPIKTCTLFKDHSLVVDFASFFAHLKRFKCLTSIISEKGFLSVKFWYDWQ